MRASFLVVAGASCVSAFVPHLVMPKAASRTVTSMKLSATQPSRRDVLEQFVLGSAAVLGVNLISPLPVFAAVPSAADVATVRSAVRDIIAKTPDQGPTIARLAWHSSGTYDKNLKNGGSGGGTIRFKAELDHGANAGLPGTVEIMEDVKKTVPSMSYADLYTLAGAEAIEAMGGPKIAWRGGRVDKPAEAVTPDGRLPAADKGNPMDTIQGLRDTFYRMGFNDQEIVALSGAHALGRCHTNASGYDGPWTPTPTTFNNAYFTLLKNLKWTPREWTGPFQYKDASGTLMMLPSDVVLLEDPKFKSYVDKYAADQKLFFSDFSKAFTKLEELGTSGLVKV